MNNERLELPQEDQTEWLVDEEQAEEETKNVSIIMAEVNYPEPLTA